MTDDAPHSVVPEDGRLRFRKARRWARIVMGFTVILIGLVLAVPGIPGPGFLFVIAGLAILATEYVWARRYLNRIKEGGAKLGLMLRPKKKPSVTHDEVK